jgi:serine/threonine-protein kinase mTOR
MIATGDKNESRRYSAVFVLKELTINSPTLIFTYIPQVLDLIWLPLRDSKVQIREGAADALNACLVLVQQRESNLRRQWYKKIFDEIQKGFKLSSSDAIHGSLLALSMIFTSAFKVSLIDLVFRRSVCRNL